MTAPESRERVILIALFALVVLVGLATVTPWPVGVWEDDGIYTVLAKSLAEGHGFRLINLPGSPHNTHFPPGYPLLLAGLWKLWPSFPGNIVLFKFVNVALLGVTAIGTYRFARERFAYGVSAAFVIATVSTLSISVLVLTGVIMSEPLFMAILLPSLLFAERVAESGRWRPALMLGLLLGALALVRTVGAVAIPAAMLVLLARGHWRATVATAAGGALLLIPWQLWVVAYQHDVPHVFMGKYGSYSRWLVEGYAGNGWAFARDVFAMNLSTLGFLGYMTMPVRALWPRVVAWGVLLLVFGAGAVQLAKRAPVTALFLFAYMAIVLIWPFEPARFLVAIWPPLVLTAALGVRVVWRARPAAPPLRLARGTVLALLTVLAVGYATYQYQGYREQRWVYLQREAGAAGKEIAEWVAHNSAPDETIVTDHELIVYLYTDRQAVPTSTVPASDYVRKMSIDQRGAALREILSLYDSRIVIASGPAASAARYVAAESPDLLRERGALRRSLVFERLRAAAP